MRSLLRVGRWAAQDHTAGRWESWDETRVCLVPLSARSMVLCCLWGLSSFGIYTSTQRLLRCLLLGHLPREITVSVLEEASVSQNRGKQMREEARTSDRHIRGPGSQAPPAPPAERRALSTYLVLLTNIKCFLHSSHSIPHKPLR